MTGTRIAPSNVPTFAGLMLVVLGVFNVLDGIVLVRDGAWAAEQFLLSDADTWGWVLIGFAVLQLLAGIRLLGSGDGRTLALVLCAVGMVVWFALLFTIPFAALIGTAINFSIIAAILSTE
jgi:hypothetical protein